jgi:Uma2 family endonuclease
MVNREEEQMTTPMPQVLSEAVASSGQAPLNAGDRLTLPEFERRYAAHPELKKAELLEGVVHVPSPTRAAHARFHALAILWLGIYAAATPQTEVEDNATVRLNVEDEVQPDALLRLLPEAGGGVRPTLDGYLEGPPELVVEIAASSAAYDLHVKRRVYARSGVRDYIVLQVYERRVDWFTLGAGGYESLPVGEDGILRSERFPGLWLDPAALLAGDAATLLRVVQQGIATPEHAAFAARLGGV